MFLTGKMRGDSSHLLWFITTINLTIKIFTQQHFRCNILTCPKASDYFYKKEEINMNCNLVTKVTECNIIEPYNFYAEINVTG